jgi:hypothetical protein
MLVFINCNELEKQSWAWGVSISVQHEPICLAGKSWQSCLVRRKQTTIWVYEKPKKNGEHPTMKPVPLIATRS